MDSNLLTAFSDELVKIAFRAGRSEDKAHAHFEQQVKDWGAFEKNLRGKGFQNAIINHPEADAKLKRYVKNFGSYLSSKDVVGKVSSRTRFKSYTVKKLPSGRMACNCPDWQYNHSTKNSDCWHIKDLQAHGMEKKSASTLLGLALGVGSAHRSEKGKKEAVKGRIASENVRRLYAGQPLIEYP